MTRVISNTFSITAQKDNEAVRDNLIHCSLMNKNRMTWWTMPSPSEVRFCSALEGKYMIMGNTGWEWLANPGKMASVSQPLAMSDRNNNDLSNSALKNNTWYTLTFRSLGICRHYDQNNQPVDRGTGYMYVYIYPSVVDTSTKYIVDGVEKWPAGDMSTPIPVTWTPAEHTITFKTASSFTSMPRILFRSFGEGYTGIASAANGSCLIRVAAIKLEEAMEATAYKPHVTEYQPPIHATAFRRTNDNLTAAPTGGSYTSPTPTTTGWSDGIPEGTARLWTTKAIFLPEETTAAWSVPSPVGDTVDLDVEFCPLASGIPTTDIDNNLAPSNTAATPSTNMWFDPTRNSTADFSLMVWRAERKILNGQAGSWVITKIKGEDGTSFTAKGSAEKHYASLEAYNAATDRVTGKYYLVDTATGAVMYKYNDTTPITCADGDAYTTSDLHLWVKNGVIWADLGKIQGPQGAQGPQGEGGMSCTLIPSVQSIPVDSNGYPTISGFTLTAKVYKGSTLLTSNDSSYSIVYQIGYSGDPGPESSSTNTSFSLYVKLNKAKVLNSIHCFIVRGSYTLHEFYLYPHADGQNTVRLDLDNEMDSVVCDNNGYLLAKTTIQTTLRLYDGASLKAMPSAYSNLDTSSLIINGVEPTATPSDDNMTCTLTWEFGAGLGFSLDRYTADVSILYNGTYYLATFTLNAMRNGKNGEHAVLYQLAPSHTALTYRRDGYGSLIGSNTLTCNIKKTVGGITSESSSISGYNIYYGYNDSTPSTLLSSGITISYQTVLSNSLKQVVLELWKGLRNATGATRVDRETIPVLTDGQKGESGEPGDPGSPGAPGADATIAWLDCPYVAIPCDQDGYPKIISFDVKAYKRKGDSNIELAVSPYQISYEVTYLDGAVGSGDSTNGTLSVSLNELRQLVKVDITLYYNTTVIQSLTLNPTLDGMLGKDGYNYLPQVLGVYDPNTDYAWDDTVRQGCYFAIDGAYNIYYVKERGTKFKGHEPTGKSTDPYWEKSDRIYTIFTDCLYGTNASIGGFLLSDKTLLSSEVAYNMTYRGVCSSIRYRGKYTSSSYYANDVVYLNGSYYLCTATSSSYPEGSSYWTKLNSDNKIHKYIIDMCSGYSTTSSSIYQYVYGYYDESTKDRPFVYYNAKFWTLKTYGKATSSPKETSVEWRELFDAEKLQLGITESSNSNSFNYAEGNIYTRSISKYVLNGREGTTIMLQPDDTIWTYDMTGKQVLGVPYGKHIEIDPSDGKMRFYGSDGTQNGEVSGESVSTLSDLLGTAGSGFTNQTESASMSGNGIIGRREQYEYQVGSNLQLTGNGALTISSKLRLFGSKWRTSQVAGGDCSSSSTGGLPQGTEVPSTTDKEYTNTISAFLVVQKQAADGSWTYAGIASSQEATSATKLSVVSTSTRTLNLSSGTYRVIVRCDISVYANRSYNVSFEVSAVTASITSFVNLHRFFGNGFAFGSASNNFFAAVNEGSNMRVKALTNAGKYGVELDKDKGLLATRNAFQGKVPMLVYYGFITDSGSALSQATKYSFDGGVLTCARKGNGDYQLTIPSTWSNGGMSFDGGNLIPTIICKTTTTGVSAQIHTLGSNYIRVVTANDNAVDDSNLIVKLEYIG